ncbi:sure-like protein [Epithele typhae]|uniref:sure-like protein n=1 Tax=Epithele typhae TaxID=378194 RepID=UPI002007608D|nr:sure-like protein [Epithele typhae]KAH9916250.1 sure-like protein [Epithele typhae]
MLSLPLTLFLFLVSAGAAAKNIIVSNDDGWATAQIRQAVSTLADAGHSVVLSAPALNQSGKGSSTKTPATMSKPCEFDSCPTGSPAQGYNETTPHLNYVNGYPVDAARYGIQTLAPQFFNGSAPDLVVSGPNVGFNIGLEVFFSGTVGAACEGARSGIPAVAFSGTSGAQVSYTTLESDPTAASSHAAQIYASLTSTFVAALTSSPGALLPADTVVNVNYASIDKCASADAYKFVFSRLFWNPLATDAKACGKDHLPSEGSVIGKGCYASVSVIDAGSKVDANATIQAVVFGRLQTLPLACLD